MPMMEFLCACNFQINRVINGQFKGQLISSYARHAEEGIRQAEGDVFLDNSTGNIYTFDSTKEASPLSPTLASTTTKQPKTTVRPRQEDCEAECND
jgi:hypothetical protein